MQFLAIVQGVDHEGKLFVDILTASAHGVGEELQERFNLPVDSFFVSLLFLEDECVVVLEVLHIIHKDLEIDGDVFLQGVQ